LTTSAYTARHNRITRVREAMKAQQVDALLISLGADMPWLTGYEAMPLERLTMLVLPADDRAVLLVPELEAPRVEPDPDAFELRPWKEGSDPVAAVADLVGARTHLGIGDRTWATFLVELQRQLPGRTWDIASKVTGPLRAVKDEAEVEALAAASAAADRVAAQLLGGEIRLVGRTEADVSAEIGRRLVAEGHQRVNFAIVGSGPNSASPHHDASARVIGPDEPVVCDFGGSLDGYCSDTTRTVVTGEPPTEFAELYAVLQEAQAMGVQAAVAGVTCEDVDAAARGHIDAAGYGAAFIHRTGHGIGLEEHEDPYIAGGNTTPLVPGHAFSVEPGIYLAGRYGARIEDIVVATEGGPRSLNLSSHDLTVVA
jgi:Xaa-Pro aminopeptidase